MKQILIILAFITLNLTSKADYRYMSLARLICEADYGAIGTIVQLDKNYFYLEVEKYVLNNLEFDTLKIQRFENWSCGRRVGKYEIGQKELVFFQKSNYVIDDYDLLGYGGGNEFELQINNDSIYYHYSYGKQKPYVLDDFLLALNDYNVVKQKIGSTGQEISKTVKEQFANKSELHKIFFECESKPIKRKTEIATNSYILNLEKNHLYQDYENKIYVFNFDIDTIMLSVKDADVWKRDNYFVVMPKQSWTRRWLNIYSSNDLAKTKALHTQLFEVLELPEPRVYFGSYYSDTIYGGYDAYPRVAHFLDKMHEDEFLDYEILSYSYTIKSANKTETFKIKSSRGTPELRERIRSLNPGDIITVSDVYVLYPNKTVKQINGRAVIVGKQH